MRRGNLMAYVMLAGLVLPTENVFCATYYVSLRGDDKNSGTESRPWRSMDYACAGLKAGDVLVIKSGDYGVERRIRFTNDGRRNAPIVVKAEESGNAILRGGGFDLTGAHHVVVEGIRFVGFTRGSAISIGDPASYIKIRKCVFEGNGANGITIWGHGDNLSLVHHLEFYENQFIDSDDLPQHQDYGISLNYGMYAYAHHNYVFGRHHQAISFKRRFWYGIAERNVFEGFLYTGLYLGQNLDTGGEDNRSRYVIAQYNVFRPAKGYRAKTPIWCANVERAVMRYNYTEGIENMDGGWGAGIHLSDAQEGYVPANPAHILIYGNVMRRVGGTTNNPCIRVLAKCRDVRVFHNTFAHCARSLGFEALEKVHFVNNIFHRYGRMIYEGNARNSVFECNCVYPDWAGKGRTDFSSAPLFAGTFAPVVLKGLNPHCDPDPRADACMLREGSPCIDAGKILTRAIGSERGRRVRVEDAGWFTAGLDKAVPDAEWFSGGFSEPQGSMIRIGQSGPFRVVEVDYTCNTLTIDKPAEWTDGEDVSLYYVGKRPDIGAHEYSDEGSFLIGTVRRQARGDTSERSLPR